MKSTIRHGAVLKCDMVTVSKDGTKHTHKCKEPSFISYSVSSFVREQAANVGWVRPKVGRVKWPGQPPMADAKKVDLCPEHAALVMSDEEAKAAKEKRKAERKAERAAARAEAKAEKKRQKAAAREVAKAVKAQKPKKRKAKEQPSVDA
jgi:hypothetical protein